MRERGAYTRFTDLCSYGSYFDCFFFFFSKGLAAKGIIGFDLCLCWWPWDEITMGKNMLCIIHTSSFLSHLSLTIHVVASWDKENMYCIAANIQLNKAAVVLLNILFWGVKYLAIIGSWSSRSSCRHCIHKYFNSMIRNFQQFVQKVI